MGSESRIACKKNIRMGNFNLGVSDGVLIFHVHRIRGTVNEVLPGTTRVGHRMLPHGMPAPALVPKEKCSCRKSITV